ncbi:hypothetical protein [Brasilonema sennae]|uniref:hypothetical protein n=1 Tax=Brasilonema sennae TaxID=1397703 RepID=UPI00155AEECE|nr:hypothetical protein [Brasilonema sennae]
MNSAELPLIPEEPHPAFDLRQSRPSPYQGYGVHTSHFSPHPRFTLRVNLSLSLLRRGMPDSVACR